LTVDPEGELDPLPLMSTDLHISPEKIIALYFSPSSVLRTMKIDAKFDEFATTS
jgi:hypothetical protein